MGSEVTIFLVIETILQWLVIIMLGFECRRVKSEYEKHEYILRELWWELPNKKGAEND